MADLSCDERDPVEVLAAEFLEKQRSGQNPRIDDFAARHPELATEIRELFPAILAMEQLKSHCDTPSGSRASLGTTKLERLGEFRLLSEIGRGGMGVVYEAHHESLGRHVAVKVLPKQSARQYRAFQREARTAARLHHNNIVPLFGVGEQDGFHYIVMQLIRGVDLEALLAALKELHGATRVMAADELGTVTKSRSRDARDAHRMAQLLLAETSTSTVEPMSVFGPGAVACRGDDGPGKQSSHASLLSAMQAAYPGDSGESESSAASPALSVSHPYWRRVAVIGRQTADALHYAHCHQTQHRDIKPANLLLDAQGVVWITDFGLAKAVDDTHGSHGGNLAGTLRYMAPEQFSGQCDHRSDIYSLGLTLYELLTLEPAFSDPSRSNLIRKITQDDVIPPRRIRPSIPRDLEAIVLKAIARDPSHRYATADELARDLQRFLEGRPVSARKTRAVERLWRWSRRNRAIAGLSAAVSVFLITTAAFATAQYWQRTQAWERETQLRAQADWQRMRAEANLQLAAEAFEDVFGRVTGAPLSESLEAAMEDGPAHSSARPVVGESEAAILKGLLTFYEQFAVKNEGDLRWHRESARAFFRSGEIQFRLGNTHEAEMMFGRALAIYQQLAASEPANSDYIAAIAATRNQLSSVAAESGRMDIALQESRQAWQELVSHPAERIQSPACQIELAQAYNRFAISTPQRSFGRSHDDEDRRNNSKQYLWRAIDIVRQLLQHDPGNVEYSLTLAESYRYLWGINWIHRQSEEARQSRAQAISMLEALSKEFPAEPECQFKLVEVYLLPYRFGGGDPPDAELVQQAERAVNISSELVQRFPQIPKYKVVQAQAFWAAARARSSQGNEAGARDLLEKGIALQKLLVEQFPSRSRHPSDLVRFLEDRARLLRSHGREERLVALEELLTAMENVADSHRRYSSSLRAKSKAYAEFAEVLEALGQIERAEAAKQKADELAAEASQRSLRSPRGVSTSSSRTP